MQSEAVSDLASYIARLYILLAFTICNDVYIHNYYTLHIRESDVKPVGLTGTYIIIIVHMHPADKRHSSC